MGVYQIKYVGVTIMATLLERFGSSGAHRSYQVIGDTVRRNERVERKTSDYRGLQTLKVYSKHHYFITIRLKEVFLPQGYPESVSEDYLSYQLWDTVQVGVAIINKTTPLFITVGILFIYYRYISNTCNVKRSGRRRQLRLSSCCNTDMDSKRLILVAPPPNRKLHSTLCYSLSDGLGMIGRIIFAWLRGYVRMSCDIMSHDLFIDSTWIVMQRSGGMLMNN